MPYDPSTALLPYLKLFLSGNNDLVDLHNGYDFTDHGAGFDTGLVYPKAHLFAPAQYIDRASNADLTAGNNHFTIAQWINGTSIITNNNGYSGKGTASGFEWILGQFYTGSSTFRFRACTGDGEAGATYAECPSAVSENTWYLVIGYHDPDADQIGVMASINGFTRATVAFGSSGIWQSGGAMRVSSWSSYFPSYMNGRIGPTMIFKGKKLDDDDVTWLYNSDAGRTYAEFAPSGTLYTVDLGGSVTPAGALQRQASKAFAGASTPAGALLKSILKASAGTVTSAGSMARQANKGLSGSTTPSGAVSKLGSKAFAGALTLSGALLRFLPRSYAGDLTPQGDLIRQPQKGLAGTVTSSSVLTRAVSLLRGGTVTPAGALLKSTTKATAGAMTPAGSVTTIRAVLLSLAGTLSLAGSVQRTVTKGLSASLATSGALARVVSKRFAGAVTPLGSLLKQARKALASLLGLGGEVQTGTGPAVHPARRQAFTSFVVRDAFDSVAMHPQPFTSSARNTRRFDSWSED